MLPGNQSQALGITPNGKTIVGYAGPAANDAWRATLHTGSGWTDLGTLGGASATAGAINRNGVVAGGSMLANDAATHAFTKPVGGQMKDLGTLGGGVSYAHAINASGQTVGSSSVAGAGQKRAFLHDGNVMHDLATLVSNPQGWVFVEAKGINDQGWIVGSGTYNGQTRGFVLIP
jgi:probable HAF family extracellular repeat protein